MLGPSGTFRWGCALLWHLGVWREREGLLRRERSHGWRWEAVEQRRPDEEVVAEEEKVRLEQSEEGRSLLEVVGPTLETDAER